MGLCLNQEIEGWMDSDPPIIDGELQENRLDYASILYLDCEIDDFISILIHHSYI